MREINLRERGFEAVNIGLGFCPVRGYDLNDNEI
jgi:hypothetical protein